MLIMKNLVANILWPLPGSDGQTSGSTAIQCNGEFEQLQQIGGNLSLIFSNYALRTMHHAIYSLLYALYTTHSCNLGNSGFIRFTNSSMTFIHANSSDGLFKVELIERATTTSMDDHLMIYSKSLTIQKLYQKCQKLTH